MQQTKIHFLNEFCMDFTYKRKILNSYNKFRKEKVIYDD